MKIISLEYNEIVDTKIEKKQIEFSKYLLTKPYNINSLFITKVDGKSMQPTINDKALVVADLSQTSFENDCIYLVSYEDKMWIKKAYIKDTKEFFISINSDFSHLIYKKEDVRVIAKVLLTFTSL